MDHFNLRNGVLHAEDVPLPAIADAIGTPFYCYSAATIERHFRIFKDALHGLEHDGAGPVIAFAVKSNPNASVLATLAALGAGADVVSEGELLRALRAGVAPDKIVFSGVGKTGEEMAAALSAGIGQFNLESEPEAEMLSAVATRMGRTAAVAFRVNPDVDAGTHAKISTGLAENKFGVPYDPRLPEPPTPAAYGEMVRAATKGWNVRLTFEPGRVIVGNAGVLVSRVIRLKQGAATGFVVVDAAMNDLLRPSLYDAWHDIHAVVPRQGEVEATVVGPVCETGDTFAVGRALTPVEPGDLVAFRTAGAYGATMAGTYNSRLLIAEVMVKAGEFAVVRRRQTLEELLGADSVAPWLTNRG